MEGGLRRGAGRLDAGGGSGVGAARGLELEGAAASRCGGINAVRLVALGGLPVS